MAVSMDLFQNLATEFMLVNDLSESQSNGFARSPALESDYVRADTVDQSYSSN